jgi:glycosyltransferase involved in cell wall biosynthesis
VSLERFNKPRFAGIGGRRKSIPFRWGQRGLLDSVMFEKPPARAVEAQTNAPSDTVPEIAVIVPVYNGRSMLEELYTRLVASLSTITEGFIIVLIDDVAPDNAWPLIRKLGKNDERVKGIRLSRNFGQHYALTAGIDAVRARWYVIMDCDLQDAPEDIPILYNRANEGHDMVVGVRRKEGHALFKRLCSRAFYAIFRFLSGVQLDSSVGNYRIFSNRVADGFRNIREQLRFIPASFEWMGFDPAFVELAHYDRSRGQSSYTFRKLFKLASDTILAHSQTPLKIVAGFGIAMSAVTFAVACIFFGRALIFGTEVVGWASLMVTILFVASLQIALMGVMGIYIGKTFEEAKRRPLYIVKDTVNLLGAKSIDTDEI